jgi:hypothetical protein
LNALTPRNKFGTGLDPLSHFVGKGFNLILIQAWIKFGMRYVDFVSNSATENNEIQSWLSSDSSRSLVLLDRLVKARMIMPTTTSKIPSTEYRGSPDMELPRRIFVPCKNHTIPTRIKITPIILNSHFILLSFTCLDMFSP